MSRPRKVDPTPEHKPRKCLGCLEMFIPGWDGQYFHVKCKRIDDSGMVSSGARVLTPAREGR